MDDIELGDIAIFVQVVDAGGFSVAARALRVPKSSVSRRVARLENRLGTRLLHRTTRSLTLTEAGRSFHARVSPALAEMTDAARAAFDAREVPRGSVRVSAPADVGTEVLPRLLAPFLARYPEVNVEVEFTAEQVDLVEHNYDLALRVGRHHDPALTATRLQDTAFRLYAAPDYLDAAGVPARPDDLGDHACVLFRARRGRARWQLHGPESLVEVTVTGRVCGNDMSFVRRATVAGAGIALLPEIVGLREVRAGRLTPVLADHHADGLPLYLVCPSARHVPLKVQVLLDHLVRTFPQLAPGAGNSTTA